MRSEQYRLFAVMLLLAVLVASCAPARSSSPSLVAPPSSGDAGKSNGYSGSSSSPSQESTSERMIVRTANLSMVVKDANATVEQIRTILGEVDGYVVNLQLWRDQNQLRGTITVRVPAKTLDDTLRRFKGLAVKVERETGTSQDVSEEYSDLGAQLRNLEATEKELQELLTTVREKTGKAEDIMAVYRELTQIRGQIEGIKGRMVYLERTAAMSAVTIELIPDVLAEPITVGGWRPSETVARALKALMQTAKWLVDAAIWIILYIAPVLLLIALPFLAIGYLWRKRRKAK
ncbi:MAG: hypothetical protein BWY10_00053 [Chloroflexi bacterium ADurb.Bin180]|nr:MAG: hypothetical protein BWY10_00053 [Chloroflexi bacterium ADurb.Bin180]HNR95663.1 DUF4349 domain-containing protein [Anaerolineae bacterium]HOU24374.1 DUF4349 domain-containing protein [Anaerolineae bacterium]HQJ50206.1 DUF4349 domain-containing protein [Anaerolineae bacterium]